jgi:hypothetical protein
MKLEHFKNKLSSAPEPERSARLVSTARLQRILLTDLCITSLQGVARLSFTARIGRAQLHRARSASKKGTWPLPPLPLTPVVFVLFRCHKEP